MKNPLQTFPIAEFEGICNNKKVKENKWFETHNQAVLGSNPSGPTNCYLVPAPKVA